MRVCVRYHTGAAGGGTEGLEEGAVCVRNQTGAAGGGIEG